MNANRRADRSRRGYSLAELAVAMMVVMTAMTVSIKVLGWNATERRASDRRDWALQTASNVLEGASALPFDKVDTAAVQSLAHATDSEKVLPGASWEIAVADDPESPVPARRIQLKLQWKERSALLSGPVRLTSWVYRRRPAQ